MNVIHDEGDLECDTGMGGKPVQFNSSLLSLSG